MAIGFSADEHMGDDSVSECVVVDGTVKVFQSYNDGFINRRLQNATFGIDLVSGSVKNNVFECSFLRKRSVIGNDKVFDIDRPWHVLFARGIANPDFSKQYHEFTSVSPLAWTMIDYSGSHATPTLSDRSTPATVLGDKFAKDSECGVTKGCYHNCDSVGCTFQVTWQPDGVDMRFGLKTIVTSRTNIWMAVGFSADDKMGDDSVNECVVVGGTVKVFQSFNNGRQNSRVLDPALGLRIDSGSLKDSVFECSFRRAKAVEGNSRIFNISETWNLMFAQGTANTDFSIREHSSIPSVSTGPVNLKQTSEALSHTPTHFLVKVHGCLMVIAWIFAVSIGMVAARYFKSMWSEVTILGLKVWFQIHRTCMVLAFVATCSGFIIIFIDVQGYSQIEGEDYKKAHPILGIIVTALVIINPIMSIFRPGPLDNKRPIFNWAHWGVGTSAYILGVICIFFGTQLNRVRAPFYLTYILAGYVAWQVFTTLVLEGVLCFAARQYSDNKTNHIQMDSIGYVEEHKSKSSPPGSLVKKIILGLHVVIVSGITVASIVVLVIN
ncbi:ferric-chelate reductase 1-like [Gigantopelta aegis]|uniref:ferric-chelate reductase 1-like n=1 Tax=Gigantopelta aegis TaxID=1735272 RepID=UPI001B88DEAD|nr:ferric-chelate reductase 1-like [Gigantopelta aegis]